MAESRSLIHSRVARLPQVLSVEIPTPGRADRLHFIESFSAKGMKKPKLWGTVDELAAMTAGLSIHAVRQLLAGSAYVGETLRTEDIVDGLRLIMRTVDAPRAWIGPKDGQPSSVRALLGTTRLWRLSKANGSSPLNQPIARGGCRSRISLLMNTKPAPKPAPSHLWPAVASASTRLFFTSTGKTPTDWLALTTR